LTYVLQNILCHLDEIVTDLMDTVSLMANASQEISYRRCESIKQDIGEKYTELCSRQTPITRCTANHATARHRRTINHTTVRHRRTANHTTASNRRTANRVISLD
jgi:hypothetical protein